MGLDPVASFSDITADLELQAALESLYGDVNNVDAWVGGLAEQHVPGSSLGELFTTVIAEQFERIRAGDSYWYQNVFSGRTLAQIDHTTLADVIERNTDVAGLQENVFFASDSVEGTATQLARTTIGRNSTRGPEARLTGSGDDAIRLPVHAEPSLASATERGPRPSNRAEPDRRASHGNPQRGERDSAPDPLSHLAVVEELDALDRAFATMRFGRR